MFRALRDRYTRLVTGPKYTDEQVKSAYGIFRDAGGDIVLDDLCARFHVFGSTFDRDRPAVTQLREGERNVVLYILSRVLIPAGETKAD